MEREALATIEKFICEHLRLNVQPCVTKKRVRDLIGKSIHGDSV